jgi:GTPase SAR1 family protein
MKIGICGSMSVGKSTLVEALKNHPTLNNYSFSVERSKYLRDLGIPLNTDSSLKGQIIFLAERASELLNDNLITDRTVYDVCAFTESAKSISSKNKNEFITLALNLIHDYDIIFYISTKGMDIEHNGVRETNMEYREHIDQTIQKYLELYPPKKLINIVGGDVGERIKKVLENI